MEAKSLYGADLIFESPYKSDLISFINTHNHTHAEMESKMQKKKKHLGEKHCSEIPITERLNKQAESVSSAVQAAILHSVQCGSH